MPIIFYVKEVFMRPIASPSKKSDPAVIFSSLTVIPFEATNPWRGRPTREGKVFSA